MCIHLLIYCYPPAPTQSPKKQIATVLRAQSFTEFFLVHVKQLHNLVAFFYEKHVSFINCSK
jgi:hypothetical protein